MTRAGPPTPCWPRWPSTCPGTTAPRSWRRCPTCSRSSPASTGPNGGGGTPTEAGLVDEVARRSGWAPERARYALIAVIGQLGAEDADLGERIGRVVPADLRGTGPTLPPDAASEGAQGRPQPVDADELARELQRLPEWSGDVNGIERTVELPPERLDLVLERLRRAESELGARLRIVDRTPTSLTVRARTESLQAVAAIDLDLAARFDEIVGAIGAGG